MKAFNDTTYPVFEADQVLTQKQLNNIVSYLEEQDRLTRTGLIGIGKICGMEVSFPDLNSVNIACGTAVTSLGFQINWQEKNYSYYQDTQLPDTFLNPNITNEPFLKPVYDQATKYTPFKNCTELIYIDEATLNNTDIPLPSGVNIIPNAAFFNNKVIMVLLEVSLIDVKNCVETSCDDKGKKLEFKTRTLLVDYSIIPTGFKNKYSNTALHNPLYIKRFNVPQTVMVSGQQVLNTFYGMLDATLLGNVDAALKSLYTKFLPDYGELERFSSLNTAMLVLDPTIKSYKSSLSVQYALRWMGDIVDAYNEIYHLNEQYVFTNCCSDDAVSMFPLHIFLGRIITQTAIFTTGGLVMEGADNQSISKYSPNKYNILSDNQDYITPWINVANTSLQNEQAILKGLLERIIHILNNFIVPSGYNTVTLKVTPSVLGNYKLSDKSIPYYYKNAPALNRVWNPMKTLKEQNKYIYSYNANTYTSNSQIIQPFNYDIEPYNFLRIEGHIGRPYAEVVAQLLAIKNSSRLPFNVIAVNAVELDMSKLSITTYAGDWGEIQFSYELVSKHWEDVIGKSIDWLQDNAVWIKEKFMTATNFNAFVTKLLNAKNYNTQLFSDFLPNYLNFIALYDQIELTATLLREELFNDIVKPVSPRPFDAYVEDFISHLDDIIMVCSKGQYESVYANAEKKWTAISQMQTLKTFVEKHPGIEHKCGTVKGGTFVIVYQDRSVLSPASTVIVPGPTVRDATNNIINWGVSTLKSEDSIRLKKYVDEFNFNQIIYFNTIPDKSVIADFYLPYICGSDGPTINFVIPPPDFEPQGDADFNSPDFNSPDFFANQPEA
jgi:hypothetical protein